MAEIELQAQIRNLQETIKELRIARQDERPLSMNQALPQYDGSAPFQVFWNKFQAISRINSWNEDRQVLHLPACLEGSAANFAFLELTQVDRATLETFVAALSARFDTRVGTATHLTQLENRKMSARETTAEYTSDVKRLTAMAFPSADQATKSTVALRYFLKGLQDPHLAGIIAAQRPVSTDEARNILDEYLSARDCTTKTKMCSVQEQSQIDSLQQEVKRLQEMVRSNQLRPSDSGCYTCGGRHLARNCPRSHRNQEINQRMSSNGNTYSYQARPTQSTARINEIRRNDTDNNDENLLGLNFLKVKAAASNKQMDVPTEISIRSVAPGY